MHGIVSLIPQPFYRRVEDLWDELEEKYKFHGIRITPYPHFSWQVAREYDFDKLEAILSDFAELIPPFRIRTAGLGLFNNTNSVIFIPLVKDAGLINIHAMIWENTSGVSQSASPYYHPRSWVPHITLVQEKMDNKTIEALMEDFSSRNFDWDMTIMDFSLIYQPEGQTGELKFNFPLSGKTKKEPD